MEDFENKLGQILGNPEMMERIMSIAQGLQSQDPQPEPPPQADSVPEIDFATIQKLTGLMGQTGVDSKQRALLSALGPYISAGRIHKLEKAMRAAKLAGLASAFLGSTALFSGR